MEHYSAIHRVPKNVHLLFLNNSVKNEPIFNDLWHVKSWENLTQKSYTLSTLPIRHSHCILGNRKKVIFNSIIHTYFWLFTLSHRKQSVIHLPTPPENITTLTCKLWNFFIWLKVCCILSDVGGSEKSQLWVVIGGSEKNPLWCVATGMSGKQYHSKSDHLLH